MNETFNSRILRISSNTLQDVCDPGQSPTQQPSSAARCAEPGIQISSNFTQPSSFSSANNTVDLQGGVEGVNLTFTGDFERIVSISLESTPLVTTAQPVTDTPVVGTGTTQGNIRRGQSITIIVASVGVGVVVVAIMLAVLGIACCLTGPMKRKKEQDHPNMEPLLAPSQPGRTPISNDDNRNNINVALNDFSSIPQLQVRDANPQPCNTEIPIMEKGKEKSKKTPIALPGVPPLRHVSAANHPKHHSIDRPALKNGKIKNVKTPVPLPVALDVPMSAREARVMTVSRNPSKLSEREQKRDRVFSASTHMYRNVIFDNSAEQSLYKCIPVNDESTHANCVQSQESQGSVEVTHEDDTYEEVEGKKNIVQDYLIPIESQNWSQISTESYLNVDEPEEQLTETNEHDYRIPIESQNWSQMSTESYLNVDEPEEQPKETNEHDYRIPIESQNWSQISTEIYVNVDEPEEQPKETNVRDSRIPIESHDWSQISTESYVDVEKPDEQPKETNVRDSHIPIESHDWSQISTESYVDVDKPEGQLGESVPYTNIDRGRSKDMISTSWNVIQDSTKDVQNGNKMKKKKEKLQRHEETPAYRTEEQQHKYTSIARDTVDYTTVYSSTHNSATHKT